jgi:hypothetical protein
MGGVAAQEGEEEEHAARYQGEVGGHNGKSTGTHPSISETMLPQGIYCSSCTLAEI